MASFASADMDSVARLTREGGVDDPFTLAVRGARMAMVVTDCAAEDHPIVFANDAFLELTGYPREEVVGRNCRFLQGPETDRETAERMGRAVREGRHMAVEILNYRKDGTPFWNGVFVSPVKNERGETAYYFGSQLDVTEKKQAELALREAKSSLEGAVTARARDLERTLEQKTLLMHEVEHRVKNNLQLITSLIQFQARQSDDPKVRRTLQEVQERVSAIGTAHRGLFQAADAGRFEVGRFLEELAVDLQARHGRDGVRIDVTTEPVQAASARAAPLALLVNEILSHELRCSFPVERGGRIAIGLRRTREGCEIELSDDGVQSSTAVRQGLAGPADIIEILRRQLGARIDWADNDPGLRALISMPVESVA